MKTLLTALIATLFVNGYSPSVNERFRNHDSFVGRQYDWSGVGNVGTRTLTMISPMYFVSAKHHFPAPGSTAVFWPTNDKSGGSVTAVVDDWRQSLLEHDSPGGVYESDLMVGRLNTSLPPTICHYQIDPRMDYKGKPALICGVGQRIGRCTIDHVTQWNAWARNGWAAVLVYTAQPGEAAAQMGDSGAPLMVVHDNALCLVGTNWQYHGHVPPTGIGDFTVVAFAPKFFDQICTFAIDGDMNGDQQVNSKDLDIARTRSSKELDMVRANWGHKGPRWFQRHYDPGSRK